MLFLHCDTVSNNVQMIDKLIEEGKTVFVLVYMNGCGPCKKTRPVWGEIKGVFGEHHTHYPDIVIADVDSKLLPALKYIGPVRGVPTMRVISEKGKVVEDSQTFQSKFAPRTLGFLVDWVMSKIKK